MQVVGTAYDAQAYFDEQRARFHEQCARFHEQCARFQEQRRRFYSWVQTYSMLCSQLQRGDHQQTNERAAALSSAAPVPRQRASAAPATLSGSDRSAPFVAPTDVTEQQWQAIAPLLRQGKKAGRPSADARVTLNGILFVLHTQCAWRAVPQCYGNYVTCWRRLLRWQNAGIWPRIEAILGLDPRLTLRASRIS